VKLLHTATEAAAALGISRSRVYELMAAGELEYVKLGRSRRIPADALESFVARLRGEAVTDAA
jgi:excisionase family DNA binding protein